VPAVGDGPFEGWLAPLDPVLYPEEGRARAPDTTAPPGCPALAGDCVVARPDDVTRPPASVAPGRHRPQAGEHTVVWWAPGALELHVEESVGLKQQKLLAVDERGERSEAGIRAHDAWRGEGERVRAAAGAPSLRVATATERAATDAGTADVAIESVGTPGPRPHGRRFGTLVHAVLASVDFRASAADVAAVAAVEARLLEATAEETAAASACVASALAHPLLRRAAAATSLRREAPVTLRLEDGALVEGVIDAAFEDGGGWTVVDFKTDVEIEGRLDEYRRQVGLYARAIAEATHAPVRAVLLRI